MIEAARRTSGALLRPRGWLALVLLSVFLVTFVGVAWFLLLVAAAQVMAVVVMTGRAKAQPGGAQLVQVAIGLLHCRGVPCVRSGSVSGGEPQPDWRAQELGWNAVQSHAPGGGNPVGSEW